MKKLYFVRHGLSEMNKAGLRSGRTDTPLAPEGIGQAHQVGKLAKGLHIDVIISSPLRRAYDTAKIIAKEIGYPVENIIIDDMTIERDFGELENTPYSPDQPLATAKDIETAEAIIKRAEHVLGRLHLLSHDTVLVVSHGSFGRALRHHTDPAQPFADGVVPASHFPNATIVELL